MDSQMFEYKYLKITDLLLNPANPRFDSVTHQTETISALVKDQKEKLVILADHIIKKGLNPTDIILVRPYNNQWLVLEGNRRVAALKLANEPDLVPVQYPKLKKDFQRLNDALDPSLLEKIYCAVTENEEYAIEWIRLKHTGENDGAGTVRWDGQQTSRFNYQTNDMADPKIAFLDSLKELEEIPLEYRSHLVNIKKTNFDRLMGDPQVRSILGIDNSNGKWKFSDGVNAYFLEVLYDLAFTNFSVGNIYTKDDRKKYISKIIDRVAHKNNHPRPFPTDEVKADEPISNNDLGGQGTYHQPKEKSEKTSGGTDSTDAMKKSDNPKSYPVNRKTLVPSQHKLPITQARIVKIFNELKRLDVDSYPNAVAALFRVFIELSVDCYISKNNMSSLSGKSTLSQKVEAVASDLESKKVLTKYELRIARQMASSQTQNASVKTFHSYMHNKDVTPSSTDLKSAWDDLWIFISGIWR